MRIKTTVGHKFCNKCRKVKGNKEFSRRKSRSDGLAPYCKKCMKKYRRKADYTELRAGYVVGDLTLKHRNDQGRWVCDCSCGKEVIKLPVYLHNKRGIVCRHKKFDEDPSMSWKSYSGIAKRHNIPFDLTPAQFDVLYEADCFYCGVDPASGVGRLDKDKGYVLGNVRPMCATCIRAKGDMENVDFIDWILQVVNHVRGGSLLD